MQKGESTQGCTRAPSPHELSSALFAALHLLLAQESPFLSVQPARCQVGSDGYWLAVHNMHKQREQKDIKCSLFAPYVL